MRKNTTIEKDPKPSRRRKNRRLPHNEIKIGQIDKRRITMHHEPKIYLIFDLNKTINQ